MCAGLPSEEDMSESQRDARMIFVELLESDWRSSPYKELINKYNKQEDREAILCDSCAVELWLEYCVIEEDLRLAAAKENKEEALPPPKGTGCAGVLLVLVLIFVTVAIGLWGILS